MTRRSYGDLKKQKTKTNDIDLKTKNSSNNFKVTVFRNQNKLAVYHKFQFQSMDWTVMDYLLTTPYWPMLMCFSSLQL